MTLLLATGPVRLDNEGEDLRRRVAMLLVDALHTAVSVVPARSYADVGQMLADRQADLAWLPPAVFVRLERDPGVTLLAKVDRSGGDGYRGVLFVPAESPARAPEDLRGQRVAWVDRDSCAGHLFVRLALKERGLDPSALFGVEQFRGSHGATVRAVIDGTADCGATHAQTLDDGETLLLSGWHPYVGADGMRPLLVTRPIPADVIGASMALDPAIASAVREALLGLHHADPDLLEELFGGRRFVPAASEDYEPVRAAMA